MLSVLHSKMESLEDLIEKCEKAKHQIISLSRRDKRSYDADLFPRSLKNFLNNIIRCMKQTPSIPSGNRFNNWWRLLWDLCAIDKTINKWAIDKLSDLIYKNIQQETITWKLKYLILTLVHFSKYDIPHASRYLLMFISCMRQATQYPIQLTYYQVILTLFDGYRVTHDGYLLNIMKQKLGDISDVEIIDPIHLTDTDQYCRTVLNSINRQSEPPLIYSIQCEYVNLIYKKLLAPVKNGKVWVDFNLNAKTITLICQRSCLRSERPSTDSEESDDCTSEILTIDFVNIEKITAKNWVRRESPPGKLITLMLNESPSYMYDSSRAAVEQANKILLNIEEGDELNRLLEILPDTFPTRFETLRKKPERQGSQQNISQNGQSNLLLTPYTGRSVSVCSMTSLENSHLEEDTQVAVAHKEMLSVSRSGSIVQTFREIQTTIHRYNNPDNWSASNRRILQNQSPNKRRLPLTTGNDDEDDSVIESSQENKPSTLSTLQEKIDRAMGKYYPEPYNPQESTTTLDLIYKQRVHSSSYKENQPVNTSQGYLSSAKDIRSTAVMNNSSLPKLSRNQPEIVTDVINLSSDYSGSEQLVPVNKSNGNGPSQVNDRLKDILVQSDYDDESVLSDTSDKSMIISGGLLNRSNIGRSLLTSSTIKQDSQDSAKNFPTKITPNRNSTTVSPKDLPDLFTQNQSQRSQGTHSSGAEFQQRNPKNTFGIRYLENVAARERMLSQKTPIGLSQKSHGSNSSSIDFQQRVAKRNNQNWNSQNQKPNLNKCLNLPRNDFSGKFKKNYLNGTAETILDSALGNPELPKKLKPTINNSINQPALLNSSQRDIFLSSQKSRTPEAVNKQPLRPWPLSVQTPDTILTNEIRDMLKTSQHYYSPQTPLFVTPMSGSSFQSARSRVSVPPSVCSDTQVETVAAPCDIEDDHSGELIIDLNDEPVNMNDEHVTNEIINAPVTVQLTVQRKRGRPSKASKACVLNPDDASDSANSTAHSLNSTNRSKRRSKKRKNKRDCVPTDEADYTAELPAAQNNDEENERKRLRRFSTRTRDTKPPIRYTDELNKTFLERVKGQIRREHESGYVTDTVVYQKRPSRRAPRPDTTLHRMNQTLDVDPTDYRHGTNFECTNVERGTQSDAEISEKRKKKKKKRELIRTEYDSSLIDMDDNIRLRLSRRNSTCDLLTQDSMSQAYPTLQPESQESLGFGAVFNQLPEKRKTNDTNLNDEQSTDTSKCDDYRWFKDFCEMCLKMAKIVQDIHICKNKEQKPYVQLVYNNVDSFITPQDLKAKIRQNMSTFLSDD